jgi:hypothetical protein
MSDQKLQPSGIQTAPMPQSNTGMSRAALAELIRRTNQTPVRIKC